MVCIIRMIKLREVVTDSWKSTDPKLLYIQKLFEKNVKNQTEDPQKNENPINSELKFFSFVWV